MNILEQMFAMFQNPSMGVVGRPKQSTNVAGFIDMLSPTLSPHFSKFLQKETTRQHSILLCERDLELHQSSGFLIAT